MPRTLAWRQARLVSRVISESNKKRIDAEIEALNLIQSKVQNDRGLRAVGR